MPTAPQISAYFLVGPTAAGKTAVAQYLAERSGAQILSADSMLVYRGMDLGTAKPTVEERGQVRYWGLDIVQPAEPFNVALFLEEARRCFQSAAAAKCPVIVVGGTGLYVKALLTGLDELPDIDPDFRARWQGVFQRDGVAGLQQALAARSPDWLAALTPSDQVNGRRLLRALELLDSGCKAPPRSRGTNPQSPVIAGLQLSRDWLVSRIEIRVRQMYAAGLLDEVRALVGEPWDPDGTAAKAIGYAEAIACIRGGLTQEEAVQITVSRTRQLAKRQLTWFRHQANVSWVQVEPAMSIPEIATRVEQDWLLHGPTPVRGF